MLNYYIDMNELCIQLDNIDEFEPTLSSKELAFKAFVEDPLINTDDYEVDQLVYYLDHMEELMDRCYSRDAEKNRLISKFSKIKPYVQNNFNFWF